MASIKAAGNQTRLFTRAQSAEEKERLRLAAQQSPRLQAASQAAGTAYPPYTGNQNPAGTAGNTPVSPAGTGGAANQAKNAYAQMQARLERDRIMTSGDTRAINQYLQQEGMQRTADRLASSGNAQAAAQMQQVMAAQARANALNSGNQQQISEALRQQTPYQAALAQDSRTVQPVTNRDYLVFGNPSEGFKSGMTDDDRASWDAIGKKYAAGDTSWNRDTNQFRTEGNWGSYYDAGGNINGWLYAGDGMGGYAPVFGGKVGESGYKAGTVFYSPDGKAFTMAADGTLTHTGNVEMVKYGSYIGPKAGYQDSSFWALEDGQYKRYTNQTAPQEVLNAQGYYRDDNGLVMPIDQRYREAQALQNGDLTPEQLALAQAAASRNAGNIPSGNIPSAPSTRPTNYAEEYTSRTTMPQPMNYQPTNYQPVQTQPMQPTVNPTPKMNPGTDQPMGTRSAQNNQNIYQRYLDQWDYPDAPEWDGTEYERQRDELLQNAMNPYEGSPYDQQRDDALAQYGEKWQGSEYQRQRDAALERAENMRWNYDPSTDPVWQALQKQYRREGDRATQDALGRYAAMTGGVPSSYAVTAASQAGDYYAAQLSDRLPQLYQDAYQRYLQEFQRQMGISDQYAGFDDREYSRWADRQGKNLDLADRYNQYGQQDYNRYMDRVSQQLQGADRYNNYGGTEYQRYLDQLGQYNTDRNFSYGRYRDAVGDYRYDDETRYGRDYQARRDAIGDARYADELAYDRAWDEEARDYGRAYQLRRDAVSDERADRAWAQELRAYADAQGWKTAEWQQYLREYGAELSDRERQWAYEMAQDAGDRQREAEETAWQRDLRSSQLAYDRERDAEADRRWETQYQQSLREYDDTQKQREFDNALKRLQVFGYVRAGDAEILGAPAGTRLEDYSGGGGQNAAGKTKAAASGKDAAENSGMVYAGTHPDGRRRTAGYGELKTILRNTLVGGSRDTEQMRRMIDDWAAQGRIEDYEVSILRREFGLDTSVRGGASGGKALQYTK